MSLDQTITLDIWGKASQKNIQTLNYKLNDIYDLNLLELLQKASIPIASSCQGQGLCKKCVINDDQLACKIIIDINSPEKINISIAYL